MLKARISKRRGKKKKKEKSRSTEVSISLKFKNTLGHLSMGHKIKGRRGGFMNLKDRENHWHICFPSLVSVIKFQAETNNLKLIKANSHKNIPVLN